MGEVKEALVYYQKDYAGILKRTILNGKEKYLFQYDKKYLNNSKNFEICLNLPLKPSPFESDKLFPFFEGLVSEGWLVEIQSTSQKIDKTDCFTMLLNNGEDLIGAVTIIKKAEK